MADNGSGGAAGDANTTGRPPNIDIPTTEEVDDSHAAGDGGSDQGAATLETPNGPYFNVLHSPRAPPNMETLLLEPYTYISEIPGKGMRSAMVNAFNLWLDVPASKLTIINSTVDMLHNASLLIDDIEDDSQMRRGVPVAHKIYGIPSVINCANYVYFLSMEMVRKLDNPACTEVLLEEILQLHRGQGLDIYWRDNNICPSEEEYQRMVVDKTGGLFRLAVKLMQPFSASDADYIPLVNSLAVFYQVRDDYFNLMSDAYMENKGYCEDLSEGKFSFPIIHAIRNDEDDHRILSILKQKTSDVEVKKHAVEYMKAQGSFEYTKNTLIKLCIRLREQIADLGGNPMLEALINDHLAKDIENW